MLFRQRLNREHNHTGLSLTFPIKSDLFQPVKFPSTPVYSSNRYDFKIVTFLFIFALVFGSKIVLHDHYVFCTRSAQSFHSERGHVNTSPHSPSVSQHLKIFRTLSVNKTFSAINCNVATLARHKRAD